MLSLTPFRFGEAAVAKADKMAASVHTLVPKKSGGEKTFAD